MLALLALGFTCCNVLSLLAMALLGLMAATPPSSGARRAARWRGISTVLLALALLAQYAVLLGPWPQLGGGGGGDAPSPPPPPPLQQLAAMHMPLPGAAVAAARRLLLRPLLQWGGDAGGAGGSSDGDAMGEADMRLVWRWLGVVDVRPACIWALAVAWALCALQAKHLSWLASAAVEGEGEAGDMAAEGEAGWGARRGGRRQCGGYGSGAYRGSESDLHQPLLLPPAAGSNAGGTAAAAAASAGSPVGRPARGSTYQAAAHPSIEPLFKPVCYESQPDWSALDWVRYLAVKHSMDLLLVSHSGDASGG